MSDSTPGLDAVAIPAQESAQDVDRDIATVIDQSIHPDRTATQVRPRHRAETPAHEPPVTPGGLVARVYETPVWVPVQGGLPPQADPAHEHHAIDPTVETGEPDPGWTLVRDREDLLRHARWSTPRNGRAAIALLLVAALFAAVASGSGLLDRQSTPTLALALSCLLAASGLYAILVATTPTVVRLDEATLTVRHRGRTDTFDLTRPYQDVLVSGEPGTARWAMRLGCPDGHVVVVNGPMVDSRKLAPVVAHAQEYAQRGRDAREERFSR